MKTIYFKKIEVIMGSYRHNHRKLLLMQRKKFVFYHGISFLDNSVNLKRICIASPVDVKYDCLAFREDMLLIHSAMNDLFQNESSALKKVSFP